jgi:hypothetical protein
MPSILIVTVTENQINWFSLLRGFSVTVPGLVTNILEEPSVAGLLRTEGLIVHLTYCNPAANLGT